jgi:hypothetical protein
VGSKNQSADHKPMFDASGYVIKWKNVQQDVYLPCGFQFTDNLGNAESKGFDLAFSLKMSDAFSFGATVAYTDAAFTEDVLKVVSGQTLPIAQNGDPFGRRAVELCVLGPGELRRIRWRWLLPRRLPA